MSTPRAAWAGAGIIAGLAGLAVSHAAAMVLTLRSSPIVSVAETIIEVVPGTLIAGAIDNLGTNDKPILVIGIFTVMMILSVTAGQLARRNWWAPVLVFAAMGLMALGAVLTRHDATARDVVPVAAGVVTWVVVLSFLTDALLLEDRSQQSSETPSDWHTRRGFVHKSVIIGVLTVGIGYLGSFVGGKRREVEKARQLLRLPVTLPSRPDNVSVQVPGMPTWQTPNDEFYQIHTAVIVPAIQPDSWSIRIHGMVEREMVLSYQDLIEAQLTERWITLNCVSNQVGGNLIGNAWWSGVLLADLLERAGCHPDADAVLQTSHDGWTCGTPLDALTDPARHAMLAVAMNGDPLPIDHGFPVRTIVPGLYGYVSACKWVIDLEVTRFDEIEAYWTGKGWSERGPVKIASRIDVPHNGKDVEAGSVVIGGHAWSQHTGIDGVQISLDGGDWQDVRLGGVPNKDTWVQWRAEVDVAEGDHDVRVRAIGADGTVQTGARADVVPDGATGWHEIGFNAK
ncbi:DMSO/TMAO reductase YedYZ molybdopterin-dependent catalytic subunit [Nocardioides daedukensis]|uniref:DMSO/TMAO reductase YedYZ molybdopterin-dependent catalytic subunit n=1 Tax=Nocardioides daedukensis TaxID=634462 RepID=A0A7Y9S3N9_9ACTN|nr:molybdopterin-dependent oxidoreductase [Nocardioides daedukensis]NYG59972.1 DMSO/TMAO reductase YedYZ molybdopterin-dependent catalytic subunit [Nocardioides daedukensis]